MGIYNTYGSVQLKCGDPALIDYAIGDRVDLADGLYVGWDGFVAIKDHVLIAEWSQIIDTHGEVHEADGMLRQLWGIAA